MTTRTDTARYVTLSDATVGEGDLLAWAAVHVSEAAAAPKAVHVLDTLPVTAVGKPYKLPLRADATRRVLADVLADIDGIEEIATDAESGTVTATVTLRPRTSVAAEVEHRVADFAVSCRIVTRTKEDG
ncbi:hypothetical protein [Streptomyces sp. NPDC056527]|uniref:hypothetical protein n=1 Tax=Streptomyces sp. NPDC056527 TaxID=3345853 RepID=UPI00369B47D3